MLRVFSSDLSHRPYAIFIVFFICYYYDSDVLDCNEIIIKVSESFSHGDFTSTTRSSSNLRYRYWSSEKIDLELFSSFFFNSNIFPRIPREPIPRLINEFSLRSFCPLNIRSLSRFFYFQINRRTSWILGLESFY